MRVDGQNRQGRGRRDIARCWTTTATRGHTAPRRGMGTPEQDRGPGGIGRGRSRLRRGGSSPRSSPTIPGNGSFRAAFAGFDLGGRPARRARLGAGSSDAGIVRPGVKIEGDVARRADAGRAPPRQARRSRSTSVEPAGARAALESLPPDWPGDDALEAAPSRRRSVCGGPASVFDADARSTRRCRPAGVARRTTFPSVIVRDAVELTAVLSRLIRKVRLHRGRRWSAMG